jgi:hypothetical protein
MSPFVILKFHPTKTPMKKLLVLLATGLLTASASAQHVNFANSGSPANLSAFFYIDGEETDYVTAPTSLELADYEYVTFNGEVNPAVPFALSIFDDGAVETHEASFTISNSTGGTMPVSANSLSFGVSGLFAASPGETLLPTFTFVSSDPLIAGKFSTSYNALSGTFTFFNTGAFSFSNESTLTFTGNFATAAIPEPSTYAAMAGVLALGLAAWQRRRRQSVA